MDPTGHYHRPDVFRLEVDTTKREATTEVPQSLRGRRDGPL